MSDKIDLSSNETRVEVDDTAQTDSFKGLYKIPIEKYTKEKQGDYLPWSMAWVYSVNTDRMLNTPGSQIGILKVAR